MNACSARMWVSDILQLADDRFCTTDGANFGAFVGSLLLNQGAGCGHLVQMISTQ